MSIALAAIIILLATLRLLSSILMPEGIGFDESIILYWGQKSLKDLKLYLYAQEFTKWEMLPSYLFGAASFLGLKFGRLLSAIMGLAEIYFFYQILNQEISTSNPKNAGQKKLALYLSLITYLLLPWHLYYSRIMATCHGVTLIFLLSYYYRKNIILLTIFNIVGLLYYTPYRLWFVFQAIIQKNTKKFILHSLFISGLLTTLFFLTSTPLLQFFTRGTYNFSSVKSNYFYNILASILFPFTPFIDRYREISPSFVADTIHETFVASLGNHPPLGFSFALLSLCGLIVFFKTGEYKKSLVGRHLVIWYLINLCLLSFMGPSTSRFVLIIPVLVYFCYHGFLFLIANKQRFYTKVLIALIFLISLHPIYKIHDFLKNNPRSKIAFPTHILDINSILKERYAHLEASQIAIFSKTMHYVVKLPSAFETHYLAPTPVYGLRSFIQSKMQKKPMLLIFPKIYFPRFQSETMLYYKDLKKELKSMYPQHKKTSLNKGSEFLGEAYLIE